MIPPAIETDALSKNYGHIRALDELTLSVGQGEIFGFLGPNGAGKTTAIRLLLDLIRPTSGKAAILSMDCRAESVAIKKMIGYLPGELALWDNLTGAQTLDYFASLRGGLEEGRIMALAKQFDLDLSRLMREYSKGNKQKVGIIQAVMHRPRVLLLDEPTGGLDPLNQQVFYGLMREATADGSTVFLSSHVFGEVQHICDRVAILRAGKLMRVATLNDIVAEQSRTLVVRFASALDATALSALGHAVTFAADGRSAEIVTQGDIAPVLAALSQLPVRDIATREPALEEAFLQYYR